MRYIVVRKQNTESLKQFKILAPVITIGRTSENSIALKDGTVSRQHCAIETSKGVTKIRDLGSFHGFQINNRQTREAVLKHGDCIVLGTFELYYVIKDDEPDPLLEGGVTQNRPHPAPPQEESSSTNGKADEAPVEEAAAPMEGETVSEQNLPESVQKASSQETDHYRSAKHHVIEPSQGANDDSDLGIEMMSGDFPLPKIDDEDDITNQEDDDLDLNALLIDDEDEPPAPAPPPPKAATSNPAKPKASSAAPSPSRQSDHELAEADAHIKQLQIEFGDLLKRFESNKAQLSKSLEELEIEKLKSSTGAKKYNRALEKIAALETRLNDQGETITGLEGDATQTLREYHELDERLHASEQQRDELRKKADELESTLLHSDEAKIDAQNKLAVLEKAQEDLESDLNKYHAQFSVARKKVATLETNLNTVQESRMRAKNLASTLEQERDSLQQQLDQLSEDRDTHHTRSLKLEDELNTAIKDHAKAEGRIVEVQKSSQTHSDQVQRLEAELAAAKDTVADLEEEMEESRKIIHDKLSANVAASTGLDEDKIKRKLGAMEKQRREAVAMVEQVRKQLIGAQQQATVLQSFLDEREALVKKLKNKLRKYESVDEDSKGG